MVLWRPALPLLIGQPVFDASTATFDGETGLGDFAFDLAYAPKLLSFEINYYVEQPDPFGPDWMIGFNVAPVVKNGLASLFGLGKD